MYQGKAISSLDSIKVREADCIKRCREMVVPCGVMIDLDKVPEIRHIAVREP
jgi:hypothetical protein